VNRASAQEFFRLRRTFLRGGRWTVGDPAQSQSDPAAVRYAKAL
jgi:hypothetical protein